MAAGDTAGSATVATKSKKVEQTVPLKLLIYSPAGNGKTYFLGTAQGDERLTPMLICDFEGGIRSIKSKVRLLSLDDLGKATPEKGSIDVVRIRDVTDFNTVYEVLSSPKHPYKTLAIDSLSELNYLNLTTAVDEAAAKDSRHDPDIPEMLDYNRNNVQMKKLIRFFRDLDMHIIFTCIAGEQQDARTKMMQYRPSLTGKLVNEVPGLVDVVAYLAVIEDQDEEKNTFSYRALLVSPSERYMAKARVEGEKLGDMVTNPTLPMLLDLLD